MGRLLRGFKYELHTHWKEVLQAYRATAACETPHRSVSHLDWDLLYTRYEDLAYQAYCDKASQSRSRLTMMHYGGSKSFAQYQYELRDIKTGQLSGRIDVYPRTHHRTMGEWVFETRERHVSIK
ncbi:putative transposase, Ptta/En/Spm, plant [Cocos nucifera]|uniref:Putative transposase, Ptta/En/Spm, plant n=1 Tax=Cocos nucifera TaxID=13894 RepID=A0A8K0I0X6_COCNU|nr:putative transposase, Ptta/En/Spm, plant [Cocos nucifera]